MAKQAKLLARIDALSHKDRALLCVVVVVVVVYGWFQFAGEPMLQKRSQLQTQTSDSLQAILGIEQQMAVIMAAYEKDPDEGDRKRLADLEVEAAMVTEVLMASTEKLIPPERMSIVLESVLKRIKGLEFVSLKGLGAEPLFKPQVSVTQTEGGGEAERVVVSEKSDSQQVLNAYKHGLRLEFEGNYLEVMAYLRELEQLPWAFYWSGFELKVDEYPIAKCAITVYTLSLDEDWLGV